jgi:hypothetical protein
VLAWILVFIPLPKLAVVVEQPRQLLLNLSSASKQETQVKSGMVQ